jgi:glycogen debranching enzyme
MATAQFGSVLERTVLKDGQLIVVADRDGDIKAQNLEGQGLYYRDRRHLSLFEMAINGTRLTLLSAADELSVMNTSLLSNALLLGADGDLLAKPRTISITRQRFVAGSLYEHIEFFNYNPHRVNLIVRFTCGSDFRDMFDVRGFDIDTEGSTGDVEPIQVGADGLLLAYRGPTGARRRTHVVFEPRPERIEIVNPTLEGLVVPPIAAMQFQLELPAHAERTITLRVTPEADNSPLPPAAHTISLLDTQGYLDAARESYERWQARSTRVETDHEVFDELLHRAALDIHLLVDSFDGNLVPTAGIPWYAVPFGRDSLIVSMQTLSLHAPIARGTLRFLARYQGKQLNPSRGEAPGKILHEVRPGATGSVADSIFYGSIDSTPLFLVALSEYVAWTADLDLARELLPNAEAALEWMARYGDADGDGFLECNRYPSQGLGDQGWKDSPDSMNHADGSPAEQPVALAEVQAYAFAAHRGMARLYGLLGDADKERSERGAAERVRGLFMSRLAMPDGYWAMGIDANGRRIETVTTNPAHALWAGLLPDAKARLAAVRLVADDMLCGWGIRTLSARARTFNPMSYHNGSVWPHDNALIALGMKRCGADLAARSVATQIFAAGVGFPSARLPELWCGFSRDYRRKSAPGEYPVACSPQGWAAGSAFMLLQALLGLEPDATAGTVRIRPALPEWLGFVSFRNLRVGDARVDFDVVRDGHRVRVDVVDDGGLRVEAGEGQDV